MMELNLEHNARDPYGNTALHYAVLLERKEVLSVLLAYPKIAANVLDGGGNSRISSQVATCADGKTYRGTSDCQDAAVAYCAYDASFDSNLGGSETQAMSLPMPPASRDCGSSS